MSNRAPDTLDRAIAWAKSAACRGQNVDDFFTESKLAIARIKMLCRICPVRELCLEEALSVEDTSRYGIYGGLTPAERAQLAKPR